MRFLLTLTAAGRDTEHWYDTAADLEDAIKWFRIETTDLINIAVTVEVTKRHTLLSVCDTDTPKDIARCIHNTGMAMMRARY